jgi:hypothetical protein
MPVPDRRGWASWSYGSYPACGNRLAKIRTADGEKPKQPKRRRCTGKDIVEPTTSVDGTESPPD